MQHSATTTSLTEYAEAREWMASEHSWHSPHANWLPTVTKVLLENQSDSGNSGGDG